MRKCQIYRYQKCLWEGETHGGGLRVSEGHPRTPITESRLQQWTMGLTGQNCSHGSALGSLPNATDRSAQPPLARDLSPEPRFLPLWSIQSVVFAPAGLGRARDVFPAAERKNPPSWPESHLTSQSIHFLSLRTCSVVGVVELCGVVVIYIFICASSGCQMADPIMY